MIDLRLGDCLDVMRTLDADSVDAIVTDPPAGISFMGKAWDGDKGGRDKWIAWMAEISAECLRVLKPGGYALVWSLPRTSHWTGMAWENGGFEPRDRIAYCFGSGFPKSLDVSKAIDKAAGAGNITSPATDAAREWAGWGTALKPAIEDWWVFRKPLSEKTVAANVMRWGTGALNIATSRVETSDKLGGGAEKRSSSNFEAFDRPWKHNEQEQSRVAATVIEKVILAETLGRFPANLITDGSDEVRAMFPQSVARPVKRENIGISGDGHGGGMFGTTSTVRSGYYDSETSASRFFKSCPLDDGDYPPLYYCAKASRGEREAGLDEMSKTGVTIRGVQTGQEFIAPDGTRHSRGVSTPSRNHHPTVKSLALMRYLITLCTRPGATVLDPFVGSGTTLVACVQLGRNGVGCELYLEYLEIAKRRIEAAMPVVVELPMFAEVDA